MKVPKPAHATLSHEEFVTSKLWVIKKKKMTWHSMWGVFNSELIDEEATADGYSAVRTDSTRIVLTALFPYVIRFSTESFSIVDGLCWMPYTDWQHHISHHLSLLCPSVQCTLLAGEVVPGSVFNLWLMFDFLPSLFPSQIVLPRNVDWNQATVSSSSMDWIWGL